MDSSQQQNNPDQIIVGQAKLSRRLIGWLATIVGVFFGLIAVVLLASEFTLLVHGKKAEGTVLSVPCQYQPAGARAVCNAEISYTTQDGQYTTATIAGITSVYYTGQKVSILYNPNDLNEIDTANYFFLLIRIIEFLIIPIAALIVGIFVLKKPKVKTLPNI